MVAMENCLNDVKQWMVCQKLKMNDAKTEFLIIGSQQQLKKVHFNSIKVGAIEVNAVESVRNLGAYFDSTMSMDRHIDAKCSASFRQLYNLRKIRKFLSRDSCEIVIHSFVFSHLDYCNSLLHGLPQCHMKKTY